MLTTSIPVPAPLLDLQLPVKDVEEIARTTCTLYVGNLSFYTTEEQIYALFSRVGEVRRIIMGLNRITHTPCGFCFVEYYNRRDAEACLKYLTGTVLDERIIRIDWDGGFVEGRQYGRGKSGGQVRDDYRDRYDPGRGGWGVRPPPSGPGPSKRYRSEDYGDDDDGPRKRR